MVHLKTGPKPRDGAAGRRVTIRLSEPETQWCDTRAAERNTTVSSVIVSAVRAAMLPPVPAPADAPRLLGSGPHKDVPPDLAEDLDDDAP